MGWRGPVTHRQFLAWQSYQFLALNRPTRGDQYLMQVACEVRRVLSRSPNNIQLDHFHLRFVEKQASGEKPTVEAMKIAAMAKAVWSRRVGGNVQTANVPVLAG